MEKKSDCRPGLSSHQNSSAENVTSSSNSGISGRKKARRGAEAAGQKRRCISTACIACRKRKSKCDGAVPSCAACSRVYDTECIYDPNSDHRRKGVYREKADSMKAQNSTLQVLIEAILNASEEDVMDVVRKIRNCDSLDAVAAELKSLPQASKEYSQALEQTNEEYSAPLPEEGERELARTMGGLRLENGSIRFIGGTSHLIHLNASDEASQEPAADLDAAGEDPITSWSRITKDKQLITHLMDLYFTWHYPYFTTLSKHMFLRDFKRGKAGLPQQGTIFCSSLLVNAMLALGCHFTSLSGAFAVPGDSKTKGDHFFAEAKRLIVENDEYEKPRLVTVQALALMSVREAGCAREAKGWVYSGMSFRMAEDIGLNLDVSELDHEQIGEHEVDARRITFWGCFLFDKCWSNYLGRMPQLPKSAYNVRKADVFPEEDAEMWSPCTDKGFDQSLQQPSRTRAIARQMPLLCEISSDLMVFFYHPSHNARASGKTVELKRLSELHRKLEDWRVSLPHELEPRDGQLPNVILMHMFFHLQYIHLFRPFLKYTPSTSPLPLNVSPRRICTANAGAISKLMRLYKRNWNMRQICNIAVYILHSACTIHLLNLPEKTARRDITHGVRHLEEIAEDWLGARRTLVILSVLAKKWACELPEEASYAFQRADEKYGTYSTSEVPSPQSNTTSSPMSDGGYAFRSREKSNPIAQYGQPNAVALSRFLQQSSTAADEVLIVPPHADPSSQQQQQQQPIFSMDTSGISFDPQIMGQWSGPSAPTPQMTSYNTNFGSTVSRVPSSRRNISTSKSMAGSRGAIMEGQEWFLNDSARWHQSFEGWTIDAPNASVFVFGEGGGGAINEGITNSTVMGGEGNGNGNMQSDTIDPLAGLEGLGDALNGDEWLSGLD